MKVIGSYKVNLADMAKVRAAEKDGTCLVYYGKVGGVMSPVGVYANGWFPDDDMRDPYDDNHSCSSWGQAAEMVDRYRSIRNNLFAPAVA